MAKTKPMTVPFGVPPTHEDSGNAAGAAKMIAILRSETQLATGCTEVGAAALVAAKAAEALGSVPERLSLVVSPNVYKNGVNVGIPGSDLRGLLYAGALGALIRNSRAGLSILDGVNAENRTTAIQWVRDGGVLVDFDPDAPDTIYLQATVRANGHRATATICKMHSRIVEVSRDGRPVQADGGPIGLVEDEVLLESLGDMKVSDIIRQVLALPPTDLGFLLEAARINRDAALTGLQSPASTFGPALRKMAPNQSKNLRGFGNVQIMTAGAAEARMRGFPVPVCALSGSGNHGITAFLGVQAFAEEIGADEPATAHALALAAAIAIYIKVQTGRLTSYCGCAIAPATGVAAAVVYLLGGDVGTMVQAMQSVIGTFSGMLCDGAKLSCAYKVSTVAAAAVQFALLAMDGAAIQKGDGIVGQTIEDTIRNLGTLNDPGMRETDRIVLGFLHAPVPLDS